jgi:FRG domain
MANSSSISQTEIIRRIDKSQVPVNSWEHLHSLLSNMTDTAWIFRGVSAPNHYPLASIGRELLNGTYKMAQEERLFLEFKHRAVALIRAPEFTDWHWLAYAQHLGVPTRLLDWSSSPLVATFFALQGEAETDRAIYYMQYSKFIHEVDEKEKSPFGCSKEGRFTPPLLFDRIRAQRGLFTVHPVPTKIFYRDEMKVLRIAHADAKKFRKALFKYGVDHWLVYPDAEGLGQQMRWQYKTKIGLGSVSRD